MNSRSQFNILQGVMKKSVKRTSTVDIYKIKKMHFWILKERILFYFSKFWVLKQFCAKLSSGRRWPGRRPDWGFLLVDGRRQADVFITPHFTSKTIQERLSRWQFFASWPNRKTQWNFEPDPNKTVSESEYYSSGCFESGLPATTLRHHFLHVVKKLTREERH